MGQPIQYGAGQSLASQDLCPLLKRKIRRHDDAGPLIGGGNDIKEELGSGFACGYVPQLIQYEQIQLGKP